MSAGNTTRILATILITSCIAYAQDTKPEGATIIVEISKFRNSKGVVQVTLYDKEADFLKEDSKTAITIRVEIEDKKAACEFVGVKPGKYAVALMHDEDKNGEMKTNFIGLPKEGIGMSRNAKPRFGPPKWKDAVFTVGDEDVPLEISMMYL